MLHGAGRVSPVALHSPREISRRRFPAQTARLVTLLLVLVALRSPQQKHRWRLTAQTARFVMLLLISTFLGTAPVFFGEEARVI